MIKSIIGFGGFAKEVSDSIRVTDGYEIEVFFVDDEYYTGIEKTKPLSEFNPEKYETVIAIADSKVRETIVNKLPKKTKYFTHINKTAQIHGKDIIIGEGSIICAGSIITSNVTIGKHSHLNLITTIGHDNVIGDYFTTAPGVQISGNCKIGNRVYFGTRSCNRQKTTICDDVIIGLNSGVINDINESGVYVGTPAKKIK